MPHIAAVSMAAATALTGRLPSSVLPLSSCASRMQPSMAMNTIKT